MKSMRTNYFRVLGIFILSALPFIAHALPCDNVRQSLTASQASELEISIAKQLAIKHVHIMEYFGEGAWSILYIDTHNADNAFLFYNRHPRSHPYITSWSGAATRDEEREIKGWTIKNAVGIPESLADCFAWYVTQDRNK